MLWDQVLRHLLPTPPQAEQADVQAWCPPLTPNRCSLRQPAGDLDADEQAAATTLQGLCSLA